VFFLWVPLWYPPGIWCIPTGYHKRNNKI
jgi:hypothetical protein